MVNGSSFSCFSPITARKISFPRLSLYLFLVGYALASFVAPNDTAQSLTRTGLGLLCLFTACAEGANSTIVVRAIFAASVLSLAATISAAYTGNTELYSFIWVWSYLGPALVLYISGINVQIAKWLSILVSATYLVFMFLGWDPGDVVAVGSRNNISVNVLFYSIVYCYIVIREDGLPSLLPAALGLIVCMWAEGRMGFAASAALFVFILFENLYARRLDVFRFIKPIVISVAIIAVIMYLFRDQWLSILERFTKSGTVDVGRTYLLEEYVTGLHASTSNVFFGVPFSDYLWLMHFNNPHNSIVFLHSRFGLLGFSLVAFYLLKAAVVLSRRYGVFFLAIVAVAILRALTDVICFTGLFDVLWWFVVLEAFGHEWEGKGVKKSCRY